VVSAAEQNTDKPRDVCGIVTLFLYGNIATISYHVKYTV